MPFETGEYQVPRDAESVFSDMTDFFRCHTPGRADYMWHGDYPEFEITRLPNAFGWRPSQMTGLTVQGTLIPIATRTLVRFVATSIPMCLRHCLWSAAVMSLPALSVAVFIIARNPLELEAWIFGAAIVGFCFGAIVWLRQADIERCQFKKDMAILRGMLEKCLQLSAAAAG
jgi:hypothetical protein